uniref:C2H2-type domain-containing protein n=1 Tax=Ciona savignyi TaxID=51511 RepID=H2YTM8_CIOSA
CHTCITCHVAFADANLQRMHYKCDWHRYNLKRKVVALPPITRESFNEKVAAQKAQIASTKSKENIVGFSCKVCQRKFNSFNSYENHLKSKKHQEAEGKEMEIVRKKLQQEDKTEDKGYFNSDEESDKQIVLDKAISVARSNLQQPNIISTDAPKPTKKFNRDDNPRLRWYRKQVRAMEEKERNKEEEERSDGSEEEWEDISDDDVTIGESSDDEISSQSESTCTDASSLVGMIGSKECLFCCRKSSNVERNVAHMSRIHGFFIPELQYLTDLEGLLSYLGEKVGVGNVCLWCNEHGHAFYSLKAVQAHMKDKGHMKMLSHGDASLEYADFYNFSASYPDLDSDNEDEELPPVDVDDGDDEDSELVLPSGARIGHRSLMRYYRQNFPPIERVKQRAGRIDRLMHQYRAIGWKGGAVMQPTAIMGTNMSNYENVFVLTFPNHRHGGGKKFERDMKFVQRMKSKFMQKLGTNNNKTMMKHLRPQVVF